MVDTRYPEHEKLRAISDESQKVGAFIEWMREQGVEFCKLRTADDPVPPLEGGPTWLDSLMEVATSERHQHWMRHEFYLMPIDKILAKYFEIDPDIIEQEKRQMLAEMRQMNERADRAE